MQAGFPNCLKNLSTFLRSLAIIILVLSVTEEAAKQGPGIQNFKGINLNVTFHICLNLKKIINAQRNTKKHTRKEDKGMSLTKLMTSKEITSHQQLSWGGIWALALSGGAPSKLIEKEGKKLLLLKNLSHQKRVKLPGFLFVCSLFEILGHYSTFINTRF